MERGDEELSSDVITSKMSSEHPWGGVPQATGNAALDLRGKVNTECPPKYGGSHRSG